VERPWEKKDERERKELFEAQREVGSQTLPGERDSMGNSWMAS